jgi:nucleoside-diphosphate-sugar epimerase
MGVDKPIVTDAERIRPEKSEVMKLISDNRKAARLLGWRPMVGLDAGLQKTIDFVRAHPDVYRPGVYAL